MIQLGGHALSFRQPAVSLVVASFRGILLKVLSRYLDLIMVRTHSHEELRELAEHSNVPVINGLDELYHPCQALADLQTIEEQRGSLPGQTVAYVGDGNNVAHSLMIASLMSGVSMKVITPSGYEPDADATQRARAAARHGAQRLKSLEISVRSRGLMSCIPMSGPRWAKKPNLAYVSRPLLALK